MTVQSLAIMPHPLDLHFCQGGMQERALRKRIHAARDRSGRLMWSDRPEGARQIYSIAHELAAAWVFAPADDARLNSVILALTDLFRAARRIEEWWESANG